LMRILILGFIMLTRLDKCPLSESLSANIRKPAEALSKKVNTIRLNQDGELIGEQ